MTHDSQMTFTYNGWGRNVSMTFENDDADFLPKVLDNVSVFLRAAGYEYVGVRKEGKTYVFHHEYKWQDPTDFAYEEPDPQDIINRVAEDYWDNAVDAALSDSFTKGHTVYYTGKGQPDQQYEHGGYKGVPLINMRGRLIDLQDSPVGRRALVRWDNWHDGHNGMGGDPDARVGDNMYWWTDVNNLANGS